MTRKDYQIIAVAIKSSIEWANSDGCECQKDGILELADRLADVLAKDNPRFDMDKFLNACKPAKEKINA